MRAWRHVTRMDRPAAVGEQLLLRCAFADARAVACTGSRRPSCRLCGGRCTRERMQEADEESAEKQCMMQRTGVAIVL